MITRDLYARPFFCFALGLTLTIALAISLGGCTAIEQSPVTAKLATQYATLKVIGEGDDSAERAATIREIAADAKRFLDHDAVTLPGLHAAVMERVDMGSLSPADRLLANALIGAVVAELEARLGSGPGMIPPDDLYQIAEVLDWVIEAAQ